MPVNVTILGAGGKMGLRAAEKIGSHSGYRVRMCENSPQRAAALREQGYSLTPFEDALRDAAFVFLAVPDALIGDIARQSVPLLPPGAMLILLDAAAAYLGELPAAPHLGMMITHPCHPPFFTEQETPEARRDYFGGIAFQDIIVCLLQGSEPDCAAGTEIAKTVFAPVRRVHRVTVEQFAFLEPAMSELIVATAAQWMKDSLDAAIAAGVPRDAAEAFIAGHAQIALAVCFGAEKAPFSDAALRAIEWGARHYIHPHWRDVFRPDVLKRAIRFMLHHDDQPA